MGSFEEDFCVHPGKREVEKLLLIGKYKFSKEEEDGVFNWEH